MTYAQLERSMSAWPRCDVTWKVECALVPTRVSVRARKIPFTWIWAGSMHTRGRVCSFPISSFPTTIWLHRGGRAIFSLAFTNQILFWGAFFSRLGAARPFAMPHFSRAVWLFDREENCEGGALCARVIVHGALYLPPRNLRQHQLPPWSRCPTGRLPL